MASAKPGREQFRLLEIEGKGGKFRDITADLHEEGVSIEDVAFGLDSLRFTVTSPTSESLAETIMRGMKVRFKGGYLAGRQEWMFNGLVTSWTPIFPNSGVLKLEVNAYDPLWLLTRTKPGVVTYPVVRSKSVLYDRDFHFRETISLSEIVSGILAEYSDLTVGTFDIPAKRDILFTLLNPVTQNEDESDYDFLNRLLRGKIGSAFSRFNNWQEQARHHGHAVFFAETRGTGSTPETLIHVLPETDIMDESNKADIKFVYHRPDSPDAFVLADEYDPSSPTTRMPISNVALREDQDLVFGDRVHVKESAKKPTERIKVGEGAEVEATRDKGDPATAPPPDFGDWEPDVDKIALARRQGELKGENPLDIIRGWPWEKAKKYFKPRELIFESSSTQLDVASDDNFADVDPFTSPAAAPGAANAKGRGPGKAAEAGRRGKKREVHDANPQRWGITVSFGTFHGNPSIISKRLYDVFGLFGRYSGTYILTKVTHNFGTKYLNDIELSR